MKTSLSLPRLAHGPSGTEEGHRQVAEETAIALTYDATTHAVMMATPADLADFAVGFSLAEGIIEAPAQIETLDIVEAGGGVDLQMRLAPEAGEKMIRRRRALAGPVGCGLCGVESIEQALRPARLVDAAAVMDAGSMEQAFAALSGEQHLNRRTRAVHAAGFWNGGLVAAREDVGRHNALDKLAGHLALSGVDAATGAVLMTSRVSVELVQKTARMGAGLLLAVSAPTALAIRMADEAGMTLVAVVRGAEFEIFTHPHRIVGGNSSGGRAHVA